jgi:clan AA aspartic protease (TIGR02281 family)
MTERADGSEGLMFTPSRPRRRRRGFPVWLVLLLILAIGAGAAWKFFPDLRTQAYSLLGRPKSPGGLVLPEGMPSMGEARSRLRNGDLPGAEADMVAYLGQYPKDAQANALLAITLTQDGHHKEALYYYKVAEGLDVGTYDFYAGYGRSLDAMGDTDGAIRMNQAALKLVPQLVDVRGSLADELVRKGRGPEALDLLESFDRQLEANGHQAYFTGQIERIKTALGGQYAKEAAASSASAVTSNGQTIVKGEPMAGTLVIQASIDGSSPMSFEVDSGASLVSMPTEQAQPLFDRGLIRPQDFQGLAPFQLANGTMVTARLYRLRSIQVGDRQIEDVLAAIYPGQGPRLLGQSFLKRFKSWSIDNSKDALVLTD